jgi:hypothetical protein
MPYLIANASGARPAFSVAQRGRIDALLRARNGGAKMNRD